MKMIVLVLKVMSVIETILKIVAVVLGLGGLVWLIHYTYARTRIKVGTGISTLLPSERINLDIMENIYIKNNQRHAWKHVNRYYKKKFGKRISTEDACRITEDFIQETVAKINEKYPQAELCPDNIFLYSDCPNYKDASKSYNGQSYDCGVTGLSFAYYILVQISNEYDRNMNEDILANVLFHEYAHHIFRLYSGLRFPINRKKLFINYIDECFADLMCFKLMNKMPKEAAEILRYKYESVYHSKNMYSASNTHPSNHFRIKVLEYGKFDQRLIKMIADYINTIKGREYIREKEIKEVTEQIEVFMQKHPDIEVQFSL